MSHSDREDMRALADVNIVLKASINGDFETVWFPEEPGFKFELERMAGKWKMADDL